MMAINCWLEEEKGIFTKVKVLAEERGVLWLFAVLTWFTFGKSHHVQALLSLRNPKWKCFSPQSFEV